MKKLLILVFVLGVVSSQFALLTTANAASRTYSFSAPAQPNSARRWSQQLALPQFDPSWGTLSSVVFDLTGYVQGSAGFENKSASPTYAALSLSETLLLKGPDGGIIAEAFPTDVVAARVFGFDHTIDYSGRSGHLWTDLLASDAADPVSVSAAIIDPSVWMGTGTVNLAVGGIDMSNKKARTSNLATTFTTYGSADVSVTYNFKPHESRVNVPEMPSLALSALGGLAGLPALRRRRK